MGALFIKLLPVHPFFLPNLFCAVGFTLFFYCCARSLVSRIEALALVVAGIFAQRYLFGWTLIAPWNTIPVAFVASLCVYAIVFRRPSVAALRVCSLALTLAFSCRPWDAVFLGMFYVAGLYMLPNWKERLRAAVVLVVGVSVVSLLFVIDNLIVFGALLNPYMKQLAAQGFSFSDYPFKVYQIFIDGNVLSTTDSSAVLAKMPWLPLMIPGMLLIVKRRGVPAVAWLVAVIAMVCFYLSANGMIPSNFWDYHGYRYLTMWVPFSLLFSYLSVTRAWRELGRKLVLGCLAAGLLIPAAVGWDPVKVAQGEVTGIAPDDGGQRQGRISLNNQPRNKALSVTLEFQQPTTLDAVRLQFDHVLPVPIDTSVSTGASVKADGRTVRPWREFLLHQEGNGEAVLIFNNPPMNQQPVTRLDLTFDGDESDTLSKATGLRAKFRPMGYIVHLWTVVRQSALEGETRADLIATPWDLTGSVAGVPDGQLDFGVDCELPLTIRNRLVDMEILLNSANINGKWSDAQTEA